MVAVGFATQGLERQTLFDFRQRYGPEIPTGYTDIATL
jgi:hypothetical protein